MSPKYLLFVVTLITAISVSALAREAVEGDAHGESDHAEHAFNWVDFSHWFGDNEDATAPFIAVLFNFAVIIFLVYILLRNSMRAKFKDRRETLKQALDEAREMKAKAEKAIEEARARMDQIDTEMADIRSEILEAGKARSAQIIADAERRAERMRADTKAMLEQEVAQMVQSIREEMAEQIIAAATSAVSDNLNTDDHNRLSREFLESIKTEDAAGTQGRSEE